ncbi:YncE family protein [Stygiolobus caldivivus]|uniref:40-residue YVTN family beta-propeller repeat protein n=1 Tax=Stygiolobus caldivivus TaxID=2824673 RepID=A0A8D5ZIT3_9CREN|nr:hypothetical protein [Stygiolobus caldivivus]BCU69916.1 hypothetical protein KN1_12130 [Stygiolobus caldivivus]
MRNTILSILLLLSVLAPSTIEVTSQTMQTVPVQVIKLYAGPEISSLVSAAVDPSNGFIYAVNPSQNDVVIFDPYNNSFVGAITVGVNPANITYFNGYFYVVNKGSGTISVIDPGTNKVVKTIYVGGSPIKVFLSKYGYIYVVYSCNVEVLNQNWQKIGTLFNGSTICSIVYDPSTGLLYTIWYSSDAGILVSAVNGTSIVENGTCYILPYNPDMLVVGKNYIYGLLYHAVYEYNPYNLSSSNIVHLVQAPFETIVLVGTVYADGEIYGYDQFTNSIWVVNITNKSCSLLTGLPVSLGEHINDLIYDPNTSMLYALAGLPNPIIAVNPKTGSYIAVGTQIPPDYILYNNVTGLLYVADCQSNVIYIVKGDEVAGFIPTVLYPAALAYNTHNGVIYAISGNELVAENPYNGSVIWKGTAGEGAVALLYDSVNNVLYVADNSSNLVLAISPENGSVISAIPVSNSPTALTYDPQNGLVYVANYNNNSVSVINGTQVVNNIVLPFKPTELAFGNEELFVGGGNGSVNYVAIVEGNKVVSTIKADITPLQVAYYDGYVFVYGITINNHMICGTSKIIAINANTGKVVKEVSINVTSVEASVTVVNGVMYVASPTYIVNEPVNYNMIYEIPMNELIPTIAVTATATTTPTTTITTTTTPVTTPQTLPTPSSSVPTTSSSGLPLLVIVGVIVVIAIIIGVMLALRRR